MSEPLTDKSRFCLPAALVQHRSFTWACAVVTAGLAGLNLAGVSLWACPFLSLTGLPCPGCGMTRSCFSLLRGDLAGSLSYHALGPLFMMVGLTGLAGSLLPVAARMRFVAFLHLWDHRLHFTHATFAIFIIYSLTRWIFLR
jgi:hypothetical protein